MEVFVIERDKLIRDRVVVGLQQFPEFEVTTGTGYSAVDEVRQRDHEVVFLGVDELGNSEGMQLLDYLRELGRPIDIVVMTPESNVRELAKQKARFNITSILTAPIEPTEFFRVVARLRERRESTVASSSQVRRSS